MPDWLAILLGGGTVSVMITAVAVTFRLLLRSAIEAERKRADEWHEAWRIERQISAMAAGQVLGVVRKVEQATEQEAAR